ncbi:MAG: hypothetical protein RSA90_02340 [Lachnospiraceae bacterium]
MAERYITDDEIRGYMANTNAKVMFIQWGRKRQVFFSDGGVSVIKKMVMTGYIKRHGTKRISITTH